MSTAKSSGTEDRMEIPGSRAILEYARHLGWGRAALRGAYVAANQLVTLSIFDCFTMKREDINETLTATDVYECRFLSRDELVRFAAESEETMARILQEARTRGDDAYAILNKGELASIGLYAAGPTPVMSDLVVHFDPPARYMYRGYTPIAYRGLRLHALGILRAAAELFDRGVPQLVTVCERTNYPATVSVLRMGWRPQGALFRIGVGSWMSLGRTSDARKIGMRLAKRAPEQLTP